jgi:hypothetical protein
MPLPLSNPLLRELYSGADRYSSDSSASDSEDETPTPSDSSSLGGTSTSVYPLSPSVSRKSLSSSASEDSPAEDLERVPHRLTRLREGVYEALRLALSLVARKGEWEERQGDARDTGQTRARALPPTIRDEPRRRRLFQRKKRCAGQMLEVHEPWSKLASVLQELKSVLKSSKGDEDEAVRRALGEWPALSSSLSPSLSKINTEMEHITHTAQPCSPFSSTPSSSPSRGTRLLARLFPAPRLAPSRLCSSAGNRSQLAYLLPRTVLSA